MSESYKIVYQGGEGEIIEKKSRFIATVRPVETPEEAAAFIDEMKKKYWNATHNCSAFVIGAEQPVLRCSDDGEPSGTAGRPMLDVLTGAGIHNVAAVVTRYFGGTLLGTGGLVKAYTKALQEGLAQCEIITKTKGNYIRITTDYQGIGKIQYLLGQRGIPIVEAEYGANVKVSFVAATERIEELDKAVREATSARAEFARIEEVWFAEVDKEIIIL